jgi:hypothetical protein
MALPSITIALPKTAGYINLVECPDLKKSHNYMIQQRMCNTETPVSEMSLQQRVMYDLKSTAFLQRLDAMREAESL